MSRFVTVCAVVNRYRYWRSWAATRCVFFSISSVAEQKDRRPDQLCVVRQDYDDLCSRILGDRNTGEDYGKGCGEQVDGYTEIR